MKFCPKHDELMIAKPEQHHRRARRAGACVRVLYICRTCRSEAGKRGAAQAHRYRVTDSLIPPDLRRWLDQGG